MNKEGYISKKNTIGLFLMVLLFFITVHLYCEELPKPTYNNSVVFSFTYSLPNAPDSEVQYIKSRFGNGLYAPLALSNFTSVDMNWFVDPDNAELNISSFKRFMDSILPKARDHGIGIHVSLSFGMARSVNFYREAKEEDIRNAQWYNDNNLAATDQLTRVTAMDQGPLDKDFFWRNSGFGVSLNGGVSSVSATNINAYVYTTPSRYARKLRRHLEAKARAAYAYLVQCRANYPGVLLIVSGPGEAELNALRQNNKTQLQEFFCDYSPFAVLEFRDWIKHEGLYASGEKYSGQGYSGGGARYRGGDGLKNFNNDFGAAFNSWNLKYYHWSLTDPVDSDYTDAVNPGPNTLPLSHYSFGGMMPASGPYYTAGGFDPPRVMKQHGVDPFWDLWQEFREAMVRHYVLDITTLAVSEGLDPAQYYTHQIAADYLFGTRPNDPAIPYLNQRYYTSASPLTTAVVESGVGAGVTMYDINFGSWYARTSQYLPAAISSLAPNWGVMEYNPEILAQNVAINTVDAIYNRMLKLYDYNAHFLGFYKWESKASEQYKGTHREEAAKRLFDAVKDKARQPLDVMFTAPRPNEGTGNYIAGTGAVQLSWSAKIWPDLDFTWDHWGDFKEFAVYRGYSSGFAATASSRIGTVTGYSFSDTGFQAGGIVYYKVAAIDKNGQLGTPFQVAVSTGNSGGTPVLSVSGSPLSFGAVIGGGPVSAAQSIGVTNTGTGILNWSASANASWINLGSVSGSGAGLVNISVNPSGKGAGTYNGSVTIMANGANGSPKTIAVTLRVYASGQDAVPFGLFETPGHGASVSSSIAVTGWVLDDIGIESVKLYRKDGNGLSFIGDAILVEGARPDVRDRYPTYPGNSRAGWGYMLLTNFLPNGGNGTFTLHVIARDLTGHEVTLGVQTIYSDNAHAIKPFGAIDTPFQGGVTEGEKYVNFGWVLTPQPNYIPIDGSTIDVYIDGLKVGKPVYNNYRSDIATLFPGYANSQGAVGYYYIDTTAYSDGVHTIAWSARDSAGNTDGIGSRYFTIRNNGKRTAQTSAINPPASLVRKTKSQSPPVLVRRGYGAGKVNQAPVTPEGDISVSIKQLERLVLDFPGELRAVSMLPVGATLDAAQGKLYWQPGLAFHGKHVIEVLCKNGGNGWERRKISITIR